MPTVLLVDDHPVVRQGLAAFLSTAADLTLVGVAGTGAEAIDLFAKLRPDVVLLDLRLPDRDGLSVLEEWQRAPTRPRVLVISSHDGDAMVARALAAGALGYVSKNAVPEEILAAIRKVARGEPALSAGLARKLDEARGAPTLTERETEVLEHVAMGLSNRDIAERLGCTEKTVKNHLNSVFAKLDASDRTHAVMIGLERGLIGPQPS